ncbi:MAG: hypothetical protein H6711_13810 [Myxococcales bacterium]|nr:hypothetical protein [Myxococcales bacterium]
MRRPATLPALLVLCTALACGGDKPGAAGKEGEKTPAAPAEGAAEGAEKPAEGASAGAEKAGDEKAGDEKAGDEKAGGEKAGSGGEAAGEAAGGEAAGADAAASAGGEADGVEAAGDDAAAAIDKLLAEVKSKKTKDDRAEKALAEAEAAGAEVADLAKAANARGEALMGDGERAQKFFEWARDKDPKNADASFNLAKMTVLAGDIPGTITHLEEVKKRGGKKLLKTVGYDPLFELVKDDPKVQALIR